MSRQYSSYSADYVTIVSDLFSFLIITVAYCSNTLPCNYASEAETLNKFFTTTIAKLVAALKQTGIGCSSCNLFYTCTLYISQVDIHISQVNIQINIDQYWSIRSYLKYYLKEIKSYLYTTSRLNWKKTIVLPPRNLFLRWFVSQYRFGKYDWSSYYWF